jgi:serine/threonine protein phosphatase PrpC
MEDRYCVVSIPDGFCAFVFDGHGGDQVSQWLVDHFATYLFEAIKNLEKSSFQTKVTTDEIKNVIQNLIIYLDEKLIFSKGYDSGSTLSGILIYQNYLYLINLGDSRTIILKGNSLDSIISEDHVPYSEREIKRIWSVGHNVSVPPLGSGDVPRIGGYSVSRAIGDPTVKLDHTTKLYLGTFAPMSPLADITAIYIDPKYNTSRLGKPLYMIAITSDGLFEENTITNDLLLNYMKEQIDRPVTQFGLNEMEKVVVDLVEFAKNDGSNDNITLLMMPITNRIPGCMMNE